MNEINIGLLGHGFMGKAHSNAYRQVRRFFPGKLVPRMKVISVPSAAPPKKRRFSTVGRRLRRTGRRSSTATI
jgi:hypothetical protein